MFFFEHLQVVIVVIQGCLITYGRRNFFDEIFLPSRKDLKLSMTVIGAKPKVTEIPLSIELILNKTS